VPPIPGNQAPHVFTFRTLKDTRAIQGIAGPAVVLGGGVLGVEAAAALALSGDNVTLVHRGEWLMEQQLDQQAGVLLEEVLAERGFAVNCRPVLRRLRRIRSRWRMVVRYRRHVW
jgi:nitrite reductase (NADH) large subunit